MITSVAAGVLLGSMAVMWTLSRTKVLGSLAVTGFVLGALATIAMLVLVSQPA